jgi:hypothetical protein
VPDLERLTLDVRDAMRGDVLSIVLVSISGAIIGLGGTSRCDCVDVFSLNTACVNDNAPATGGVWHAVARCAEVEDL